MWLSSTTAASAVPLIFVSASCPFSITTPHHHWFNFTSTTEKLASSLNGNFDWKTFEANEWTWKIFSFSNPINLLTRKFNFKIHKWTISSLNSGENENILFIAHWNIFYFLTHEQYFFVCHFSSLQNGFKIIGIPNFSI